MVIDPYDEPSSFIHTYACTDRKRNSNSNNKYKQKHEKSIGIPIIFIFIFIMISFSSFHNPKTHPQQIAAKRSMKQTTHLMIHIRFISSKEVEKKFSQKHHHESPHHHSLLHTHPHPHDHDHSTLLLSSYPSFRSHSNPHPTPHNNHHNPQSTLPLQFIPSRKIPPFIHPRIPHPSQPTSIQSYHPIQTPISEKN